MKSYIKKDLKTTHLILEGVEGEQEDYQSIMLRENEIAGILKMHVHYLDNQLYYQYDISGKESLELASRKAELKFHEMETLVNELLEAIQSLKKYMLDGNRLLLDPEYIFREDGKYYFCYYPGNEEDSQEAFHRLTEFFVREVNYCDEAGVHFAYTLHKATMQEHYSIEEIMRGYIPELPKLVEDSQEVTFIESIEEVEEEPPGFWEKIKNLWRKLQVLSQGEDEKYL